MQHQTNIKMKQIYSGQIPVQSLQLFNYSIQQNYSLENIVFNQMSSLSAYQPHNPQIGDHLARAIKLSFCYLTFYIVQILMAIALCSLLFFDHLELISFVEVPIAFFIGLDLILSNFVETKRKFCSKIQTINLIVLVGSVSTIMLDLTIPHVTRNRVHTIFNIILSLRYILQSIWILKLGFESKKIIDTYKNQMITLDFSHEVEQELTKMTL